MPLDFPPAPIVHQSTQHEAMNIKDFVAGGGDLKSNLTHNQAGVLVDGVSSVTPLLLRYIFLIISLPRKQNCEREVDSSTSHSGAFTGNRSGSGATTPGGSNIPANFGGNRNSSLTGGLDRRGSNSGIDGDELGSVGGAGSGQRGALA